MYLELLESEYEKIKEISKITLTDYELKGNLIPVDSLVSALEDMLVEYHNKEYEIEELKQDIEDNYELKKVDPYTEYGVSESDFLDFL